MTTYQLGPVIGKIGGGAEVQKIPVNIVADGYQGTEVVMHTVDVPVGETWLVVLAGILNPNYTSSAGPVISIGGTTDGPSLPAGTFGLVAEVTGTTDITIRRNTGAGAERFSGHIYTAPLPA